LGLKPELSKVLEKELELELELELVLEGKKSKKIGK
jgi:hypothetical protein